MGGPAMLEVENLNQIFHKGGTELPTLQNVSLHIDEREFVSIIGPSGCGKSTLFNIIAGLMEPDSGTVTVRGQSIIGRTGTVGYMLQKDMLLPWRTILANVTLGLEIRGVPRRQAVQRAMPLIARYGLDGFENHYPHELSGGMRQRAAFLRTLLYDRDILLLDEPFGALDAQTRLAMQNWLLSIWKDFKKTVLFVTHDIDEAIYLSDRIYVFSPRPGHIRAEIPVPLPRPRRTEDITSPDFMALKEKLLSLLFRPEHSEKEKPVEGEKKDAHSRPDGRK